MRLETFAYISKINIDIMLKTELHLYELYHTRIRHPKKFECANQASVR